MSTERMAFIRADAGPVIGVGHVMRCVTLAHALCRFRFRVQFITHHHVASLVGSLASEFKVITISADDDRSDAAACISAMPATSTPPWVVVDHLTLGAPWESAVRATGARVLAIDDLRHKRHDADLLTSDVDIPFASEAPQLIGPAYALIALAFAPNPRPPGNEPRRVLVSYGGSDPTRETEKALRALESIDVACDVTVIVGRANQHRTEIDALARGLPNVRVEYGPNTIAPFLEWSDIVLSAGGQTMVEALSLRRVALITITAENQRLGVGELAERGIIQLLGDHDRVSSAMLADSIQRTFAHHLRLVERLDESPFDHLGPDRVVEAMLSLDKVGA